MNDNEQRDELARELFIADNSNQPREASIVDWEWFEATDKQRGQLEHYKNMAAGMIAAGYRKPRTITTVEELDALTDEAVVRSDFGVIHEKRVEFDTSRAFWVCPGDTDEHTAGKITLPATVLQEPTTEATR